ncbi:TetR/AcrR family transcriptional regulator [Streptosporangium saharense]|uniref:TetR/AcrR family transcriptional regulator n=1 Tax=Streptosporangium saharense TaxID=1706840 RepID=UPI0036BBDB91
MAQAKRDPEGRRRAIIEAAAELLVEDGGAELTHRRAAERAGVPLGATTYYFSSLDELREEALRHLAEHIEGDLRETEEGLAAGASKSETLAEMLHAYMSDQARVRADAALFVAAVRHPALRPLARRWSDGLAEVLSAHTDMETARALSLFADGVSVHAILHDEPVDAAFVTEMATRLLREGGE